MTIDVICPGGHKMKVTEKYAGKTIRCPKCSQETVVPQVTPDSGGPVETLAAEKQASAAKVAAGENPGRKPASPPPSVKKTPAIDDQKKNKETQEDEFGDLDEFDQDFSEDAFETEDDDFDLGPALPSKKKKGKGKKKEVVKKSKPASSPSSGMLWIVGGVGLLGTICAIVVAVIVMNRRGSEVSPAPVIAQTPPNTSAPAEVAAPAEPTPSPAEAIPKVKERPRVSIPMPASVKQLVVGGSGNYLVAAMPESGQVAVVDVRSKTIGNPISVDDNEFLVAAGESKFVVVKQNKNQIARYDLSTGALEHSASINPLKAVAMGCSSEGPILGIDRQSNEAFMIQLVDLKRMPGELRNPSHAHKQVSAAASADGTVFSIWAPMQAPCGVNTLTRTGPESWAANATHSGEGSAMPSPDGHFIITSHERFDNSGKKVSGNDLKIRTAIPSATGPVYLDFNAPFMRVAWQDSINEIQLRSQFDDTVLAVIKDITFPGIKDPVTEVNLPLSQRVHLCPNANALVTTTHLATELVIHDFNLADELRRSDEKFLLVASSPPTQFQRGENFKYQVEVISKGDEIGYSIEKGPTGFEISSDGIASWQVPVDFPANPVAVTIGVQDKSGAKVSHSFTLKPPSRDRFEVLLPGKIRRIAVAGSGSHLIVALPDQKEVAIVDVEERKVEKTIPIDESEILVAGGESKFVIHQRKKGTISRFDLATLEREVTIACEPFKAIAMGASSEGPLLAVGKEVVALNLQTLKPLPEAIPVNRDLKEGIPNLRAAANGRVFTAWCDDRRGAHRIEAVGNLWDVSFEMDSQFSVIPSSDGQVTYTCYGRFDSKLKSAEKQRRFSGIVIPALTAPFNILMEDPGNLSPTQLRLSKLSIRSQQDDSLVLVPKGITLPRLPVRTASPRGREVPNNILEIWDRLIWLDSLETLITIPETNDRLFFYDFDLQDELINSGSNYFFISSVPPRNYIAGEHVSYQIEVMSKDKNLEFSLESGPAGMAVSPTGLVTWQAPGVVSKDDIIAVVHVQTSTGQKLSHTIRMSFGSEAQAYAKKKQQMKKAKNPNPTTMPRDKKRQFNQPD